MAAMNAEWYVFSVWVAGALATAAWLAVHEWPTRHQDAANEGLPDHTAFIIAGFAAASLAWFLLPLVAWRNRSSRMH